MQILTLQDEGSNDAAFAPDINTFTDPVLVKESTAESKTHRIPDFLNRLYLLDNFDWNLGGQRGQVLSTYRFPDQLLAQNPIKDKITNFYGLRAGVELIVLVNNQKFQQGNLLISYLPNAKYNLAKKAMHDADLQGMVSRSGAPRVNLDLMDTTRASLKVPYMSPFVFYNLINDDGTIGDFYISVYAPLYDVAATGKVSVSVYARFIDVDLEFPTAENPVTFSQIPAVTDSLTKLRTKPNREKLVDAKTQIDHILHQIDNGTFTFQMNTEAGCFKQKALPKMATSDDNNLTHMLSTHSSNSLTPVNTGQASTNEMNFNTMLSIPTYYDFFTINLTDESGTNKWSKEVSPLVAPAITNADLSTSADYIFGIASLFKKWKGGIIYRFRAVKTRFHSLRVRVWFSAGSTNVAGLDRNTVYSKIVDLEVENSFTFEVPYIHPFNMLNVSSGAGGATSLGLIGVDIENQMVAPTSVKDSIEIIVERFGAPDLQFAEPTTMKYFPFNPTPRIDAIPRIPTPIALPVPPVPPSSPVNPINFIFDNGRLAEDIDPAVLEEEFHYEMASPSSADLKLRVVKPHVEMAHEMFETQMYRGILSGAWVLSAIPWYQFFPAVLLAEVAVLGTIDIAYKIYTNLLYKKDLTVEGIEPNPGPVTAQTFGLAIGVGVTFTSPYQGLQKIMVNVYSYQVNPLPMTVTLTGNAITGSLTVSDFAGYSFEFYYIGSEAPTIDAISTSDVGHMNVIFNTVTNPSLHYQMGMDLEQDMERTGVADNMLVNPLICNTISKYCIGNSMNNVHQMIGRSSLFQMIPSDTTGVYHLFPHAIGVLDKTVTPGFIQKIAGHDNLSFFANFFTFARGTVNFRIQTTGGPYRVAIDPDNDLDQTALQDFESLVTQGLPLNTNENIYASNLMQQAINTNVEGFGEFAVPFYSSTFCYSINPQNTIKISKSVVDFTHPDTQTLIIPGAQLTELVVFRNAAPDFEMSYLSGPPLLDEIALSS